MQRTSRNSKRSPLLNEAMMTPWIIKTAFPRTAVAIICGLLQGTCNALNAREPGLVGNITKQRLLNIGSEPGAWLTGGRDHQQSYCSPLADIIRKNVKQLGFAWDYEVDFVAQLEATPVVVDGVMFTSGNKGAVLSEQEAQAIRAYLTNLAWENYWKSTEKVFQDFHRK